MSISAPSWPRVLYRVARDRAYEALGHLPAGRVSPRGKLLSGIQLGLSFPCNGSPAYVAYHGSFFRPEAYRDLARERVAWLRIDELGRFNREVLPGVREPIVVVTAESDWTMPSDFPSECAELVASGKVRRWFATNYDGSAYRDLVTRMPIGMNFRNKHTLEHDGQRYVRFDAPGPGDQDALWEPPGDRPAWSQRIPRAFGDFRLNNSSRNRRFGESREDIAKALRGNPAVVFPDRILDTRSLAEAYRRYAFVVSPHGRALDCFRTWEALQSGAIAIVKRSALDPLYEGLPVAIVGDWSEVTEANLRAWSERFGEAFDRAPVKEALSLESWVRRIRAAATGP